MPISRDIIATIRNLIRHEQSARKIGSVQEAERFAEKIQTLLFEHKVSAAQIGEEGDQPEAGRVGEERMPIGRNIRYGGVRVPLEDSRLMHAIAGAHFCHALVVPQSNVILIIGTEEDRAVVSAMFRFLVGAMKRLARQEEQAARRARKSTRQFKPYFYLGFTSSIRRRYQEIRRKADGESAALVLVRADQLTERYVAENYEAQAIRPRKPARINKIAFFSGVAAGSRVDLSTRVMSR